MEIITKELFELNPHRVISVDTVGLGRHHIITIDNFFQHPERIRQLLRHTYYVKFPKRTPALRHIITSHTREIYNPLFQMFYDLYHGEFRHIERAQLNSDVYLDKDSSIPWDKYLPHVDNISNTAPPWFALVIYMNKVNIHGGTQLVRSVPHQKETIDSVADKEMLFQNEQYIDKQHPWDYPSDQWERYHMMEMKYNRLVAYRSNLLHAPYTNGEFYLGASRRIISGFF